ncbi:MAG: hypothetical protein E6Q88_03130 [Lysobacteraceae bacterium]|nr:MAG: hypothetical protein E6Q88_03130 [Xanthomonadaceae bacterium]
MITARTPVRNIARICGQICLFAGAAIALMVAIAPLLVPVLDPALAPAPGQAPLPVDASLPYAILGVLVAIFGYGLMRLGRR